MSNSSYDSALQNQIRAAGFDVRKIPKSLDLHFKTDSFATIPTWIIKLCSSREISPGSLALYCAVSNMCYHNKAFAWASREELARRSGLSIRTVYTKLNELVDAGAIVILTQMTSVNKSKSLIFRVPKRNTPGTDEFISSHRGNNGRQRESMPNPARGACRIRHEEHAESGTREHAGFDIRSIGTSNQRKGSRGREVVVPNFSATQKNSSSKVSNITSKAKLLIKNYYAWINSELDLSLIPRKGDFDNAYELIDRKGANPETFLKFIKENAGDNYFAKTDKHFSIWTSAGFMSYYSEKYNDVFTDDVE